MVAATFEKAYTYVFAEPLVWDREVGGSNPLAPTIFFKPTFPPSGGVKSTQNMTSFRGGFLYKTRKKPRFFRDFAA